MNPVIEKLWVEAAQESDSWEAQCAFIQKYTELCVQECLNIVEDGGEFCSRSKLAEQIAQHFGVK